MGKVDIRKIIVIDKPKKPAIATPEDPAIMTPDGPIQFDIHLHELEETVEVTDNKGHFVGEVKHEPIKNGFLPPIAQSHPITSTGERAAMASQFQKDK